MNMPQRAAESLLAAAIQVEAALGSEDEAEIGAALARRERAFSEFRAAVHGPVSGSVRATLERVAAFDAALLSRVEAARDAAGRELGELRRAREAVRALEPGAESPRFVSRRA
jgi:hypothetical protein